MGYWSRKKKKFRRRFGRRSVRGKYTAGWSFATDAGFQKTKHHLRRRGSWKGNYNPQLSKMGYHPAYQPAPGESHYSGYHSKKKRNERKARKSRRGSPSSSQQNRNRRGRKKFYWYNGRKYYRRK